MVCRAAVNREWSPPPRVEMNSTAQTRVQAVYAKVAELHNTMEETQQRAATTQSNVAAALAASAAFESKCVSIGLTA